MDNLRKWDFNPETNCLLDDDRLLKRLSFGTAGLRAEMGPGYSKMNHLVVIQTTQGLYEYLVSKFTYGEICKRGIVIGYDHRQHERMKSLNSKSFAEMIAAVFVHKGVPVYLYSMLVPTPLVPFGMEYFNAIGGIMVTASHNPKNDNGYKLYWENGAQIIPPHDVNIAKCIEDNLEPWRKYTLNEDLYKMDLVKDGVEDVLKAYMEKIQKYCRCRHANENSTLKIAYTAMHGVGYPYVVKAFEAFGLKEVIPVECQVEPDAKFPTVEFPNPEEGKGALKMAMETAEKNGCTLILANDPDADRLAVAEMDKDGNWKIFTGNEIGCLLGYWEMMQFQKNQPDVKPEDVYVLASTVSSKMLRHIAKDFGYQFMETLTGFKWMGNKTDELVAENKHVLFSFEEAIGFCIGTTVKDKDGVAAAAIFAEMANQLLSTQGKTVCMQLDWLYEKYGQFVNSNHYIRCEDTSLVDSLFHKLRNPYATTCGEYRIANIRDQTTGYDSSEVDQKTKLPETPTSNMITYTFENGYIATIRTSGTEPKVKYYIEGIMDTANLSAERETFDVFVSNFVSNMLHSQLS